MKKRLGLFLIFPLMFSQVVFAETSPNTACAYVFTDTTEQPTAFTEFNNGGGSGVGQFGCQPGQMSAKYYAFVAAQGESGLSSAATTAASSGASIDAQPCGSYYGACFSAYNAAYSAKTTAAMANVAAQTKKNSALAK